MAVCLNPLGHRVIRFSNHQVSSEFDAVLDAI
jgi:very-short-patch-repair endonuclease